MIEEFESLNNFLSVVQALILPWLAWISVTLWRVSHELTKINTRLKYGYIRELGRETE